MSAYLDWGRRRSRTRGAEGRRADQSRGSSDTKQVGDRERGERLTRKQHAALPPHLDGWVDNVRADERQTADRQFAGQLILDVLGRGRRRKNRALLMGVGIRCRVGNVAARLLQRAGQLRDAARKVEADLKA